MSAQSYVEEGPQCSAIHQSLAPSAKDGRVGGTWGRNAVHERTHSAGGVGDAVSGDQAGFDPEAVMQQVRAEVARRRVMTEHGSVPDATPTSGEPWHPAAPRLPDKDQYRLADFLVFDDEDFVDVAYRKLLRRPAIDDGSRDYVGALRGGAVSKVEVLGSIRFSDEGRRNSVHVDGLLLPYKLNQWRRKRIVGWFIGMGMAVVRLPRLAWHLQHIEAAAAHESHALGRLLNRRLPEMEAARTSADAIVDRLHSDVARLAREQQTYADAQSSSSVMLEKRLDAQNAVLAALQARLDGQDETSVAVRTQLTSLQTAVDGQHASFAVLKDRVLEEQRRSRIMMERLAAFLEASARQARNETGGEESAPDARYAAFEDAFRGQRSEIKQRVAHYLGTLSAAGIEPNVDNVVLDLGSGRGEWLEVLAEHGYRARGVDLDRGMLAASAKLGHDVIEADALDFLRVQDEDTFSAITAMHLVEHVPNSVLIELLDQTLRVLRPGGVLILETPNPENVLVGACTFYLDPTHRNPIPPLLLQWMVQSRGFQDASIERLTEHRGAPALQRVADEVPGADQINQMVDWFTAAQDYAVIARKPATS